MVSLFHKPVKPEQRKDTVQDLTDQKTGQIASDSHYRNQKYDKKNPDDAGNEIKKQSDPGFSESVENQV